ncbi:histidine phosphatase family protein [Pseudosulfitobacter koreensis]|uniref:Histidine phosphatase family protein n=1 Tax=Pseudosulfitobacter koreensis TaxID=2968472 RepID=A0ABT1YXG7_9RHOB|nr:histidine phosphatase family protein [Pseudosulfitobacter koreense]MCR8825584.1 histidine phosphatase family protein [Pseudosulfitobacter koreense]
MSEYPDLLILRHGETTWNREARMQGAQDSPLTAAGRAQARHQGAVLSAFGCEGHAWYASPQGRAWQTAELANTQGAAITADARLAEIAVGDWSGLLFDTIRAEAPHLFEDADSLAWYDHAPGGEGLAAVAARTLAFLDALTGPAVVVTHGITSRILRCHLLGLPWSRFDTLQCGQGVVWHLSKRQQQRLS